AEDGIRCFHVTGVQTCALPISERGDRAHRGGRGRPESQFDAETVFRACQENNKAVEINCRPDRLDPPKRLLRKAYEMGCLFSIRSEERRVGEECWFRVALCG